LVVFYAFPTPAQTRRGVGQVDAWLRRGMAPDTIREVVARVLRRPNIPRITGLGYFTRAIEDAKPIKPGPRSTSETQAADPVEQAGRDAWVAAMKAWQAGGCVFIAQWRAAA
jgi:hypothetical protein